MDNKQIENVLKFDLSPKQIRFKDILNKEFIELEVWAISTIYPNRNKSHFTVNSLINAIPNVKNKPIVGFFKNGDFTTHEGTADYDPEYKNKFWNTERGERILGWIRESDPVEVVEKDGLHWLKFRCMLCTSYCYKQVKRLLKDRRKKVSVEIKVKNHEFVDGIEIINEFSLIGVTILGSKNGKSVLEAIPNAHLSVLEGLDDDVMEEQRKVLTFAYSQLDDGENVNEEDIIVNETNLNEENTKKEVKQADMDNLDIINNTEVAKNAESVLMCAFHIKVDKSAEAMSDKPWGEVDKTELRHRVVEADNFKEVAEDIFLDLREGWEDGEVSKLKYPVMELKDNTAVYNREGLASAKGYATQHDEKEILEKLSRIYESLGIEDSEEEAEKACKMCDGFKEEYCYDCDDEDCDDDHDDDHDEDHDDCDDAGKIDCENTDKNEEEAAKCEIESVDVVEVAPDVAVITDTDGVVDENKDTLTMEDIDIDLGIPQCTEHPNENAEVVPESVGVTTVLIPEDGLKATIANDETKAEIDVDPANGVELIDKVDTNSATTVGGCKDVDAISRCNLLEEELCAANKKLAECEAKLEACFDYEEIKSRLADAEGKLYAIHLAKLKQCAIELMCNENIKKEYCDEILAKCADGKYSCEDDIKKDVAIAIYSSRPIQEKRFSVSIPVMETIAPENRSAKSKHMTASETIKAFVNK